MKTKLNIVVILGLLLPVQLTLLSCADKSVKYYNLGVEAAEREDLEEAIRMWKKSLEYRPDDPETRYNLGTAYLEKNLYKEAEDEFHKAAILSPDDHEVHYGLGKSLEMQDKHMEAKRSYERSTHLKPDYVPSLLGLASCALKKGQNRSAENYATMALKLDPRNLEGNLLLSEAYYRNGNYQAAYVQLLSARKYAIKDPQLLLLLGKVTYARRMYVDALEALTSARSAGLLNSKVFLYLGLTSLALEQLSEAEKYFRLSVFKDSTEVDSWKGLGDTYIRLEDWDRAAEAFSKGEEIDPDNQEIALGMSLVLLNSGRYQEAVNKLELIKKSADAPTRTLYYLGHAYIRVGRKDEARESFESFLSGWQGDAKLISEVRKILEELSP